MQKLLGQDIKDPIERVNFLKDNCDGVESKGYMKRFDADQMAKMKEDLSENSIASNDIELEKKEAIKDYASQLKPLKEQRDTILKGLKNKAEHVTEAVFRFTDLETRETGFYNNSGELIESRPAYADELQTDMFKVKHLPTGTANE